MGSVALIIGATLLPFGAMEASQIPPAWCLECGDLWLTDAISNVALFVPFGAALAWRGVAGEPASRSGGGVVSFAPLLVSFALSALVESLQYLGLPPGRSPALADIITNTTGGLLGAWGLRFALAEGTRSAEACGRLAIAWTALALGAFALTAVALQPAAGTVYAEHARPAPLVVQPSPFGHVPDHGWYEGITDSATITTADTVVTRRRGRSGPIIAQLRQPVLPLAASVWVRSTDPLRGQIPLLFLHRAGDGAAWLQLAKHGHAAELSVTRRGSSWGLAVPALRVPAAFAARTVGDTSTLGVHATVTPQRLALATSGAVRDSVSLALTPVLGWALIQPVFEAGTALAPIAAVGWLLALLVPAAWWSVQAGRSVWFPLGIAAVVGGILVVLPVVLRLHPLLAADWLRVAGTFSVGTALAAARHRAASGQTRL
jgi:hypothetical protein